MDLLGDWASEHGVDLEVMSHISTDIRNAKSELVNKSYIKRWLREKASISKPTFYSGGQLPPLICNSHAFSFFEYPSTEPNFVGFNRVTARVVNLDKDETIDCDLENVIVMIPQADPGYDWLFGLD